MKKFIFILSCLVPLLATAYDFKDGQLYYTVTSLSDLTVEVANASGNYINLSGSIEVPASATYNNRTFTVTRIGEEAFANCDKVTSVTLPSTIKEIGNKAFWYSGLTTISLNEGLIKIENQAFANTKIVSINIPNSVTTFTGGVFADNGHLTNVKLSDNLTTISSSLFARCGSLNNVIIPEAVTKIEAWAFEKCYALSKIVIPNSVTEISNYAFSQCSALSSVAIGSSVTSIKTKAFENCTNLSKVISFALNPPTATSDFVNNITYLDATLYVPEESVSRYKSSAPWSNFVNIEVYDPSIIDSDCKVNITGPVLYNGEPCTELNVPKGTKLDFEIAVPRGQEFYSASCNNSNITQDVVDEKYFSIIVDDAITNIKVSCVQMLKGDFRENGFYFEVLSENNVGIVGGRVKYSGDVVIPSKIGYDNIDYTIVSIGKEAFKDCNDVLSIQLPTSISTINDAAFQNCKSLQYIEIPDNVVELPRFTFYNCEKLAHIKLPEYLSIIGGYVFYNCSTLTEIELPTSISSIGDYAFANCTSLTSLTVPENAIDLYWCTMPIFGCSSLNKVTFLGQISRIDPSWFTQATTPDYYLYATVPPYVNPNMYGTATVNKTLYVPENSIEAYKSASFWKNFVRIEPLNPASIIDSFADSNNYISTLGNTLYNLQGKTVKVFNTQGQIISSSSQCQIVLPRGIYFVEIENHVFKIAI